MLLKYLPRIVVGTFWNYYEDMIMKIWRQVLLMKRW